MAEFWTGVEVERTDLRIQRSSSDTSSIGWYLTVGGVYNTTLETWHSGNLHRF